jgi:sporulation protein YlmC with PRC-barrel domain
VIRASDLIGCVVRTESGRKLGSVHDLRAHAAADGWLLMGLVVGSGGMRERLGAGGDEPLRGGEVVAWEAIVRLDDGLVTVRDEMATAPLP